MASSFETIMLTLVATVDAGTSATVLRGAVLPEELPANGLIILRDGEPGEPEVSMSPLSWYYDHLATAEIYTGDTARDAAFDVIRIELAASLAADRSLNGTCDWVEPEAPAMEDLPLEGGATVKAAIVPIRLSFATNDPLG